MTDVAERRKRGQEKAGGWGETIRTVVYAVLIALVVRTFAIEPFNIPSGSMIPTLLVGDYLFVSKYSYGYSKHSFPFSMGMFPGRVFGSPPERGDVAVFKYPGDQGQGVNRTDYIKRIVGMPGDRIQVTNGVLHINGKAVERLRIGDYVKGANGHYQKGTLYKRDAAQRPQLHRARVHRQRHGRQHAGVPGAGRQLLRHGRQSRRFARQSNAADAARLLRARRAIATSSAGTCRPRTWSAAPSSSSSRTIHRRPAGWSRGNGHRRSASAASSGHPLKDAPVTAGDVDLASLSDRLGHSFAARRARRRGADPSRHARQAARPEGRLPARQRAAGIPGRPRAVAGHGRSAAAPLPAASARASSRAAMPLW